MDGQMHNVDFLSWQHTDTVSVTGQMLSIERPILRVKVDPAVAG